MTAVAARPLPQPERFGLLWWLPCTGEGNGLSDTAWAPIAEVAARVVPALLAELRAAGVAAFAAAATRRPKARRDAAEPGRHCVWVGTSRYCAAEETLRIKLPALLRQAGTELGACRPRAVPGQAFHRAATRYATSTATNTYSKYRLTSPDCSGRTRSASHSTAATTGRYRYRSNTGVACDS